MNVARILYPVKVLGPGNRIGIWVAGCSRECPGCSNPELWRTLPEQEITADEVMALIGKITDEHPVDGFTISGGEPFDQAAELAELIHKLKSISDDILLYTGYLIEELRETGKDGIDSVLDMATVVIDGPYMEELNDNSTIRGSSNQRIYILNGKYAEKYRQYFTTTTNTIQNFTTTDGIVSVGIHRAGWRCQE